MEDLYRGYRILGDGTFGYFEIKQKGSGDVPDILKGVFTSKPLAMRAIDASLSKVLRGRNGKKQTSDRNE